MITKTELKSLSELRIKEAKLLYAYRFYSGAYYLAGYSIELAIKACACDLFSKHIIPDKKMVQNLYKHDLNELVKISGIYNILEKEKRKNPEFKVKWSIVSQWSPESRYQVIDQAEARSLIYAIDDKKNGVLKWMKENCW